MKLKSFFFALALMGIACVFLVTGPQAATPMPDVIKMDNKTFEHTKGIVTFNHKKHVADYGDTCGDCHHNDKGQPLTNLKEGDSVQPCMTCHKKPGEVPRDVKKEWRAKKLSKDEMKKLELEYYVEAVHENCIGCHKKWDKENKSKAAPTSCSKCHPKK
jgi:hypothetical protein